MGILETVWERIERIKEEALSRQVKVKRRMTKKHFGLRPRKTIKQAADTAEQTTVLTPSQRLKVEQTMVMIANLPSLPIDEGDPTAFLYDKHGLPR